MISGQPGTAADPAPVTGPVALVLSRQARAGHEQTFDAVLHHLAAAVRSQPRHLELTRATRGFLYPARAPRPTAGAT